ncbi:hypothetical protein ABPG77_004705 [Micractinium sp. CCAP 211/92]
MHGTRSLTCLLICMLLARFAAAGTAIVQQAPAPCNLCVGVSCPSIYSPVCCAGRTFSSLCMASCCIANVKTCVPGTCACPTECPGCAGVVCPANYDPVCCCGKTFSNSCQAKCCSMNLNDPSVCSKGPCGGSIAA